MPRWIDRRIPSMFHRRLLLLTSVAIVPAIILILQLGKLTLVEGAQRRRAAESVLLQRDLIPTARGRVLDRRMRVLATDSASFDVSVSYSVISGRWAYAQAYRDAYRANRQQWRDLGAETREALILEREGPYLDQVQMLWQVLADMGQVDSEELGRRRTQVLERVAQIASSHALRRMQRLSAAADGPISHTDAVERVHEETIAHALLMNVPAAARVQIESFIAESNRRYEQLRRDERAELESGMITGAGASPNDAMRVWREVSITPSRERQYPHETIDLSIDRATMPGNLRKETPAHVSVSGVGLHLLGMMRQVWKEDADKRPFRKTVGTQRIVDLGGYLPGDQIGSWGIELAQEDRLRGLRGQVIRHLDTLEEEILPPLPGRDVVLSIDIHLQARIQALLDPALGLMKRQEWHRSSDIGPIGEPLCGAAVVLDVTTGQVLAAVSTPGFSLEQIRRQPETVYRDTLNRPYVNRAVGSPLGGVYSPGSTIKPLMLVAAMSDRKLGAGEAIACNGHLDAAHPGRYRCWIFKTYNSTHGPLAAPEAMARSCNIFFYTLGRREGPRRVVHWYSQFGLGMPTGCGILDEVGGDLPDLTRADEPNAPGFTPADAIFMAIGQGPVRWTPLQAANAYATIARGGYHMDPTLLIGGDESKRRHRDLQLDPRGVEQAMQGLFEATNERYGTGHHITLGESPAVSQPIFNIEGVRVMGKSGTAQAVPLREEFDDDGDGRPDRYGRILRQGDHAWFVGMVKRPGSSRPDYVVTVIVEFAGSGGKVGGPIANQILHAMRAEGYL
jgi:penicillin-binding protein 2